MPSNDRTLRDDRALRVRHVTRYRYDADVERSVHAAHLRPVHDRRQTLLEFDLKIEVDPPRDVERVGYEDCFGNEMHRFEVAGPYRTLAVIAESRVVLHDRDPFAFKLLPDRPTVPLNWLPRERLAMSPYLLSQELPDTQLEELFEYAMGFVRDNDGDLMEALFALNLTLFKQYEYVSGSTSNATTPYEVFSSKRGVCQDFAGLFIVLARLIGVPARYVCGYLYTGNADKPDAKGQPGASRAPSDATHAWVQVYLPNVGWKGFDPTNGVLPRLDHVRLAVGRFWRDTSPVNGTLYGDRVKETLEATVEVHDESA